MVDLFAQFVSWNVLSFFCMLLEGKRLGGKRRFSKNTLKRAIDSLGKVW